MPAGLDGNPDPIVAAARSSVLHAVARAATPPSGRRATLAVDGASGTGKSTFADELARVCDGRGVPTLRATVDSFHRPRAERYRRGPDSPEGYYLDSHDLAAVRTRLLEPFRRGDARVCRAAFDEPTDTAAEETVEVGSTGALLIVDGLFLHRPELAEFWDVSVFLLADARREAAWQAYLTTDLPADATERTAEIDRRVTRARRERYVAGQARYESEVDPTARASFVIDNDELERPLVLRSPA